jgi:hypothetical protein
VGAGFSSRAIFVSGGFGRQKTRPRRPVQVAQTAAPFLGTPVLFEMRAGRAVAHLRCLTQELVKPKALGIIGAGAVVKIDLSTCKATEIAGAITDRDVKRAERLVARNVQKLRMEWESLHERRP